MAEYCELLCRSHYSFLNGGSSPAELMVRAAELRYRGLALTDSHGVYGIPKAYHAWTQLPTEQQHCKLICGSRLAIGKEACDGELALLATDRASYGLLCRCMTLAHHERPKGKAWLSWAMLCEQLHHTAISGLIALPLHLQPHQYEQARDLFAGNLFIPLSRHRDGHDQQRTQKALDLHKRLQTPVVAVGDVHYHLRSRRIVHDVMRAIHYNVSLAEAGYRLLSNGERHLQSPAQRATLFADLPTALHATVAIRERVEFCPSQLRYRYPSEWIPAGYSAQQYLHELTWQGARQRYPKGIPDAVAQQLQHELQLIESLLFADYFLTIYDIVDFAKKKKILCQGRGSAANSAVCYCLGITAIDPVRMTLLFERFISTERGEPPDIDVDFEHERREEVIQYIYEKYGRHRAAMVSAVITYRSRSALRDVCKAFGVAVGTQSARQVERSFDVLTKGDHHTQYMIRQVCEAFRGAPRHLSIHSGGFTLSADPITEIVPVEPARMGGRTIIQWDKYDLDYLGLLKIDVLALGMLSALHKCLDLVGMQLHEIPAEDPKTYRMIQKADTIGTFQIESRAQMSMLGRLQPRSFYDLVIQVAIVRPGPIVGNMVHPYLRRRRGEERVVYVDPRLRDILGKTLGVPLFQEQVMKLAMSLAGFNAGEADELRCAIGAWRSSASIHSIGHRLMQGLLANGLPHSFAQQIYEQIQGFAKYGFPESHAASFALIAYASSYLKCHYPTAFACAMVNAQPLGFYRVHTLLDDAKRHGVRIRPLNPHHAEWDCRIVDGELHLGWRIVRGLGRNSVDTILEQRQLQPFQDLNDFMVRSALRAPQLERLAMADAFAVFGLSRREALWHVIKFLRFQGGLGHDQYSLFEKMVTPQEDDYHFPEPTPFAAIRADYENVGLSLQGHPVTALRAAIAQLPQLTNAQARCCRNSERIRIAGLIIVKQRPSTAKGVTFCTLEDESGLLDLVVKQPIWERYEETLLHHCFVIVEGTVQRDGHSINVLVHRARPVLKESNDIASIDRLPAIAPARFFR